MRRCIALCSLLALVACTDDGGREGHYATQVWATTMNASTWALLRSAHYTDGTGQVSIDFADRCATTGTYTAVGMFDKSFGVRFQTTYRLEVALAACNEQAEIVDGRVSLASDPLGDPLLDDEYVNTWYGSVVYRGLHGEHVCDLAFKKTIAADREIYAGTICGFDLQTDLGITPN